MIWLFSLVCCAVTCVCFRARAEIERACVMCSSLAEDFISVARYKLLCCSRLSLYRGVSYVPMECTVSVDAVER